MLRRGCKSWPTRSRKSGSVAITSSSGRPRRSRRSAIRSYFISTTPRTGGFLLAEALESTGIAGRPREYFDPLSERQCVREPGDPRRTPSISSTILAAGTTPNGVFGAKVLWHQFVHLMAQLRLIHGNGLSDLELLRRTFPDLRYVFLTRRDKIRQAISYDRAIRSGVWWSIGTTADGISGPSRQRRRRLHSTSSRSMTGSRACRNSSRAGAILQEDGSRAVRGGVRDFVESYESTVLAILRYLDLPISDGLKVAPPRLQKQADLITEEWVRRYQELKGFRPLPAAPVEPNNGNSCLFTYSHISDSKRGPG